MWPSEKYHLTQRAQRNRRERKVLNIDYQYFAYIAVEKNYFSDSYFFVKTNLY